MLLSPSSLPHPILSLTTFTLLLALHPTTTLSVGLKCTLDYPLPPYQDCVDTIKALDARWKLPGENLPRAWGRTVEPDESEPPAREELPRAFRLKPSPGSDPRAVKDCEFYIDNKKGREREVDHFTLQLLTVAVSQVLLRCFPYTQTGIATPLDGGSVEVLVRKRGLAPDDGVAANVTEVALEPVVGGSDRVLPLDGGVLPLGGNMVSRSWVG